MTIGVATAMTKPDDIAICVDAGQAMLATYVETWRLDLVLPRSNTAAGK